jgi:hypothetical protein
VAEFNAVAKERAAISAMISAAVIAKLALITS